MSRAYQSFEYGIKDAEELLAHFDALNANPPPANAEVLKRAGLVMALTAWETYVEDRLLEEMNKKLGVVAGSYVGDFVLKKLHTDLKQFHNPSSDKTKRIFQEYLGLDVTEGWSWAGCSGDNGGGSAAGDVGRDAAGAAGGWQGTWAWRPGAGGPERGRFEGGLRCGQVIENPAGAEAHHGEGG